MDWFPLIITSSHVWSMKKMAFCNCVQLWVQVVVVGGRRRKLSKHNYISLIEFLMKWIRVNHGKERERDRNSK